MCTSIMLRSLDGKTILGRNMDFASALDPDVFFVPAGFTWSGIADPRTSFVNTHGYLAAAQGDEHRILIADGVNDAGFAGCELYFTDFASYKDPSDSTDGNRRLAALEFLSFCLGMCESIENLPGIVASTELVGISDPYTQSVAPLHWIFADPTGSCAVIECTAGGFHLYDNPLGVMTNSPDFPWQMTNLRNYLSLHPLQSQAAVWGEIELETFAEGFGTWGMPGDHTPPSRFVKTAFQKTHLDVPATADEAIVGCFHLLDSVSIPKGSVALPSGYDEHTLYASVMNLDERSYCFTSYDNHEIVRVLLDNQTSGNVPRRLGKIVRPMTFYSL